MSDKMSPKELKSIFEKYAAREGDPNQLSKEGLEQNTASRGSAA